MLARQGLVRGRRSEPSEISVRRRRPPISSLLATGRPASRRQRPSPVNPGRPPALAYRTDDLDRESTSRSASTTATQANHNEAGALAAQITDVQRAAGQLRMAEAVLDQVALHLVEMETYFTPAASIDADWRKQGIESAIRGIRELFDLARVNGRKLFGGVGAIEARTADASASLELPALNVDSLGDPRHGMIATCVNLPACGSEIIAAAQLQTSTQKARVCEFAAMIGEMVLGLQIALEMHAAAGSTFADDEFAQAVAHTSQADIFLATQNNPPTARTTSTMLRIRRQPL